MKQIKLAYIGGGSLFVPSVINGIARHMKDTSIEYLVNLVLFDIDLKKAEKMKNYGDVVAEYYNIPLRASIAANRKDAIDGADIITLSVSLKEEIEKLNQLVKNLNLVSWHPDGLMTIGEAVAVTPFYCNLARDIKESAPNSWLLTLVNPTDIMCGFVNKAFGIRCMGLCVEVDGLRGALGYYFNILPEAITIYHAGVNHDGWVLDIEIEGESVYDKWKEEFNSIIENPNSHPGNYVIPIISELTGYIKSSGYHYWPYNISSIHNEKVWEKWRGKRERCLKALEEALTFRIPVKDHEHIHPELSLLYYPLTGESIGKLVKAKALNTNEILSLQIRNDGSISNFPQECIVEIPTLVNSSTIKGLAVGELPEWLGGYTKLLAIQRSLLIDYLLNPDFKLLKRALSVFPMIEETEKLISFAKLIHESFTKDLCL